MTVSRVLDVIDKKSLSGIIDTMWGYVIMGDHILELWHSAVPLRSGGYIVYGLI